MRWFQKPATGDFNLCLTPGFHRMKSVPLQRRLRLQRFSIHKRILPGPLALAITFRAFGAQSTHLN
jgi:hypothetical protein